MFKPLPKRETLVETVVARLTESIAKGQPAPGERLPSEASLAVQFGVSRTVIREAVARLKADDLVHNQPGKGLYINERDGGEGVIRFQKHDLEPEMVVTHLFEMRNGLEADSARFATLRRTPESLARIRTAYDRLEQATQNGAAAIKDDLEFHLEIARASQNPFIVKVLEFLSDSISSSMVKSRMIGAETPTCLADISAEHTAILDAIMAGDAEAAARAMRHHTETGSLRYFTYLRNMRNAAT